MITLPGSDHHSSSLVTSLPPSSSSTILQASLPSLGDTTPAAAPPPFFPHSIHCYFVLPGNISQPVIYHVDRVRDGRSFCVRSVKACQGGRCILAATCSFVRDDGGDIGNVEHGVMMPKAARGELERRLREHDEDDDDGDDNDDDDDDGTNEEQELDTEPDGLSSNKRSPFKIHRFGIGKARPGEQTDQRTARQWFKARGPKISRLPPRIPPSSSLSSSSISSSPPPLSHFPALAYISDSWFIGTVARVHNLVGEEEGDDPSSPHRSLPPSSSSLSSPSSSSLSSPTTPPPHHHHHDHEKPPPLPLLLLSLDHTIYFHNPRATRIDRWLYSEMSSPWAGSGRGLVTQRVWDESGVLVASCFQEGVVRVRAKVTGRAGTGAGPGPGASGKVRVRERTSKL